MGGEDALCLQDSFRTRVWKKAINPLIAPGRAVERIDPEEIGEDEVGQALKLAVSRGPRGRPLATERDLGRSTSPDRERTADNDTDSVHPARGIA